MARQNANPVKIETLELGDKFKTTTGMEGFLIQKGLGSVQVLIHKVPKKRYFHNKDGSVDSYWTGKLRWSPDTEVVKQ
tara:strand:+ start:24 stop:257 length:234 start_codon:yes stop_codon:yes gene_type:complete